MAVLEILMNEHTLLRKKAKEVKKITPEIKALCQDLLETMQAAPGVGLAANQIGVLRRVIVIELPEDEEEPLSGKPFFLINPSIVKASGSQIANEGCLSVPGYWAEVTRSLSVTAKGRDLQGRQVRIKAKDDLLAQALEHEMDHINGVLYVDHLESLDELRKTVPESEEEASAEL